MTDLQDGKDKFKQLARVEDVRLEIEEHGILTIWIELNKEGGLHQAFGGYSLDGFDKQLDRRIGTAGGLDFILRTLQIFEVSKLEDIKGKMCYALYDSDEFNSLIQGIRTLEMDGGKEFLIDTWQKQWFPKESIDA